jgi:hypothetical protein
MRRVDVAWFLLWAVASTAWTVTAARELSAVFDEPNNLRWGVTSWRTGSNYSFMRAGTMPLPPDVQYLPIHWWERARGQEFDVENSVADFHAILPYARLMSLPFWWALLAYGTLLAGAFGGPWAGRFAVVLLATEPSLLGHAGLAMTDICLTAFVLAFAYHYHRGRDAGPVRRWLIPGVLYGLGMAAKASALTFVPIIMLAFEIPRLHAAGAFRPPPGVGRLRHLWRSSAGFRSDCWKILVVGTVVVWTYCGCDWQPLPSFVRMAEKMPEDNRWTPTVRWLARNATVFPNAGQAFAYQIKHNFRGHPSNTLGEWYPRSIWFHFPVLLTIKLTLVTLGLTVGLLVTRLRSLWTPLGLAALLLLLFSLNCRVQIGVRLVFPLVAFILLTLAVGLTRATASWSGRRRTAALAALSLACVYPAATIWPDGLRYANELWGGPEKATPLLADANYDWGQGLKDLDQWTAEHGLPTTRVWYYGMDPVMGTGNPRLMRLHDKDEWPARTPADVANHVRGKVVAVGNSLRYGYPGLTPQMPVVLEFFRGQEPVGRTRTFLVYDFRELP